jgi:hypothetical protein
MLSTVSTPKATGISCAEADLGDALGALAGHVLEVRRAAADHGTEGDDRVVLAAARQALAGQGNLEGAGHAHTVICSSATPWRRSVSSGAVEEVLDHKTVPAPDDQRIAPAAVGHGAFDGSHRHSHISQCLA